MPKQLRMDVEVLNLRTRHPFIIARGGQSDYRTVWVRLTDGDGVEGWGEAAPSRFYGETAESVEAALRVYGEVLPEDPFALEDAMWNKYKLGEYFKINDPATSAPAVRNPYYVTPVDPSVPDMTLKSHIERGVKVAACDMAIHYYSGQIAKAQGFAHDDVKAEWMAATLPGISHAPSGVVAHHGDRPQCRRPRSSTVLRDAS